MRRRGPGGLAIGRVRIHFEFLPILALAHFEFTDLYMRLIDRAFCHLDSYV